MWPQQARKKMYKMVTQLEYFIQKVSGGEHGTHTIDINKPCDRYVIRVHRIPPYSTSKSMFTNEFEHFLAGVAYAHEMLKQYGNIRKRRVKAKPSYLTPT